MGTWGFGTSTLVIVTQVPGKHVFAELLYSYGKRGAPDDPKHV